MSVYSDLDLSFKMHPITGDVAMKTDDSAVRQALQNLIQTNFLERGFNVELGSNIRKKLFENVTPLLLHRLKSEIQDLVDAFEPRVSLTRVEVYESGANSLSVTLSYFLVNTEAEVEFTFPLQRIR